MEEVSIKDFLEESITPLSEFVLPPTPVLARFDALTLEGMRNFKMDGARGGPEFLENLRSAGIAFRSFQN